jgi:tetratricopeptide (TPR) repeat protein
METKSIDLYRRGRDAFNDGRYDEARKSLVQLLSEGDNFADALNMMGVICYEEDEYDEAKDYFRRALEVNPNYTEAGLNLAVAMNDTGEYPEGEAAFNLAYKTSGMKEGEVDPYIKGRLSNLHADLGEIYHGMGLFEDALREYGLAIKLRPAFPDIRTRLGVLYRDMGLHDKAVEEFLSVRSSHPDYNVAGVQLGITYYGREQIELAMAEWGEVLRRDPTDAKALMYVKLAEKE